MVEVVLCTVEEDEGSDPVQTIERPVPGESIIAFEQRIQEQQYRAFLKAVAHLRPPSE